MTSAADSGPGTLRQALLDAQGGDTISFDSAVFPPSAPGTIYLSDRLPPIVQGNLTIDASNAGVVLDGSNMPDEYVAGLEVYSNGNTVWGLQLLNFSPGVGIALAGGVQNNTIGGDRSIGSGPLGRGNLVGKGSNGIALGGDNTSSNTITGNLIGTDPAGAGDWGNEGTGIWLSNGASHNTIGPGNVIAYGRVYGVEILESVGNTIIQNSIHDNARGGIYLWEGANAGLPAPAIFDFDLTEGTLTGTARPNATVEVFSDSGDQGRVYEGKTMADSTGWFAFRKGTAFVGPHLTATATDAEGNTSVFSVPTTGNRRHVVLQQGNNLPKRQLQPKKSKELMDNRIGSVGLSDAVLPSGQLPDLQQVIREVTNLGLKHIRFTIVTIDGNRVDWDKPEFTFEQRHHDFLKGMAENGVTVKYLLYFRDDALGGKGRPYGSRFKTEDEIQRYLDYVRFIIGNVRDHVRYFEIWNEPNIRDSVQWIEVEDYINLIRRVVPVIRQEHPEAKIVLAGTTYLREPESQDYLFSILRSDIMSLVDVVSWHPMFGASPEFDSDYYHEYPAIVQRIKDTASAHGFKGEYEAGEISWWTEQESEAQEMGIWYGETAAAKYHARGTVMHLGMDVRVTHGAVPSGHRSRQLVNSTITNLSTIMAGAKPASMPVEVRSEAEKLRSYAFSLANGDGLLALWTDGVAVDDDPGTRATVTIPGVSAKRVVGIDVLHGFEQELEASIEDGNLVIPDLLIKDYPVILQVTDREASTP